MKPRIFIGSSNERRQLASALATAMGPFALGVPWLGDVFKLGQGTVASLETEAATSDFAVFVFAADDAVRMRGEEYRVARDNVVYELGLFSGALRSDRCYILVAEREDLHLPSDLRGLTLGTYDPAHKDELVNAVTPFVDTKLHERVRTLGFRHKERHRELYGLITKYAACDEYLIGDLPEQVGRRLNEKRRVWSEMLSFCNATPANKDTLLNEHYYVAFAAAVVSNPDAGDSERILRIRRDILKRGDPQAKVVDAMMALRKPKKLILDEQRDRLANFADGFLDQDSSLQEHINNFRRM